MSTPSRFKKDKEIIAEYESQVKGKRGEAAGKPPRGPGVLPAPSPGCRPSRHRRRGGRSQLPELRGGKEHREGGGGGFPHRPALRAAPVGPRGWGRTAAAAALPQPGPCRAPSLPPPTGNARGGGEGKGKGRKKKKKKACQLLKRETMLSHTPFLRHMAGVSHPPLRAVVSVLGCRRWLIKNYP